MYEHVSPRVPILCAALALLTTGLCRSQTSVTTFFNANNAGAAGWTNFFDIELQAQATIDAIDVNVNLAAAAVGGCDVYLTAVGGTHVGNELNGAVWTLAATTANLTSSTFNLPTNVPLTGQIPALAPGRYGMAVTLTGGWSPAYTNGDGFNQTAASSNCEARLTLGTALSAAPGVAGTLFNPRIWNGTVYLTPTAGYASACEYGSGCGESDPATIYEVFDTAAGRPSDLANLGWSVAFLGAEYLAIPAASPFVTPSGSPVVIGDDETQVIGLPFQMPIRTGSTNTLWVCSNGWIALEATTSTDQTESVGEFILNENRVAGCFDDLDPTAGGSFYAEADPSDPTKFHVTWMNVPEWNVPGSSNTFQISFDSSGGIEVKYGAMITSASHIVGFARGRASSNPGPVDFSNPNFSAQTGGLDIPPLRLSVGSRPALGATATAITDRVQPSAVTGALLLSFNRFAPGALPLDSIGLRGCDLLQGGQFTIPYAVGPMQITHSLTIGNDPVLSGLGLYLQSAVIAPGVNQLGIALSNGVAWTVRPL